MLSPRDREIKARKKVRFRTFRPYRSHGVPLFRQTGVDVMELLVMDIYCRVGLYDSFLWKLSARNINFTIDIDF